MNSQADRREDALGRSTHTMTFTYTVVHYANPFLVCETCGAKVDGYIDAPGHELHLHSHP